MTDGSYGTARVRLCDESLYTGAAGGLARESIENFSMSWSLRHRSALRGPVRALGSPCEVIIHWRSRARAKVLRSPGPGVEFRIQEKVAAEVL